MEYGPAQQLIEEYIQKNWVATACQFDNVPFNSDLYEEFSRCTIVFGEGLARTVTKGNYRQTGVMFFSIFVKPATGTARMNELLDAAVSLFVSAVIYPALPLVKPVVKFKVPSLYRNFKEQDGWVMAQASCPFYYDLEL